METVEPPKTPEEQAQLEQALLDMLEGREPLEQKLALQIAQQFHRFVSPGATNKEG
jgi:hypothetical protein